STSWPRSIGRGRESWARRAYWCGTNALYSGPGGTQSGCCQGPNMLTLDIRMLKRSRALLWLIGALLGSWTIWATLVLPRLEPTQGLDYHLRSLGVRLILWVLPCAVYLWSQYGKHSLRPLRLGLPPTPQHWAW